MTAFGHGIKSELKKTKINDQIQSQDIYTKSDHITFGNF